MVSSQSEKTSPLQCRLIWSGKISVGSSPEACSVGVRGAFQHHVHPERLILKVPMGGGLCELD